jgi:DnaD/phage-associated family protein
MLSPIEYEKINSWLLLFSEDIIKYAIEIAVNNGKKTISYLDGILKNWKGHNYQSLEEIKENESKKDKPQKEVPEWFDKNIENEVNIEATKEMDNLLEKFN